MCATTVVIKIFITTKVNLNNIFIRKLLLKYNNIKIYLNKSVFTIGPKNTMLNLRHKTTTQK